MLIPFGQLSRSHRSCPPSGPCSPTHRGHHSPYATGHDEQPPTSAPCVRVVSHITCLLARLAAFDIWCMFPWEGEGCRVCNARGCVRNSSTATACTHTTHHPYRMLVLCSRSPPVIAPSPAPLPAMYSHTPPHHPPTGYRAPLFMGDTQSMRCPTAPRRGAPMSYSCWSGREEIGWNNRPDV